MSIIFMENFNKTIIILLQYYWLSQLFEMLLNVVEIGLSRHLLQ